MGNSLNRDYLSPVKEIKNLEEIMEHMLKKVSYYASTYHRSFNSYDVRTVMTGTGEMARASAEDWMAKEIFIPGHEDWGIGIVIAYRDLENLYILGVEFDMDIPKGHCLERRTEGILARENRGLWVSPDMIRLVKDNMFTGILPDKG